MISESKGSSMSKTSSGSKDGVFLVVGGCSAWLLGLDASRVGTSMLKVSSSTVDDRGCDSSDQATRRRRGCREDFSVRDLLDRTVCGGSTNNLSAHCVNITIRGVATGVYGVYIPLNQSKQTFYGVEMTAERLLNMSIEVLYPSPPQKKTFIPQNKFLATPLIIVIIIIICAARRMHGSYGSVDGFQQAQTESGENRLYEVRDTPASASAER